MFYLIKRRKPEILHRRSLNYLNCDEGEQCGDDDFLVHYILPKRKKIVLYEIISGEDSQEITCDMRNHTIANISGFHIHQAKNDRHNQCV